LVNADAARIAMAVARPLRLAQQPHHEAIGRAFTDKKCGQTDGGAKEDLATLTFHFRRVRDVGVGDLPAPDILTGQCGDQPLQVCRRCQVFLKAGELTIGATFEPAEAHAIEQALPHQGIPHHAFVKDAHLSQILFQSLFVARLSIKCRYIHSEVDTLERVEILRQLRAGDFDVLIGVNLLREGLDLPEVSLVAIIDADKEGFLRNEKSLVQTVGRAARNVNGMVIMYADKMTNSMQRTIDETARRRTLQEQYNTAHGLTPTALIKAFDTTFSNSKKSGKNNYDQQSDHLQIAADPVYAYMTSNDLENQITNIKKKMQTAAKELDFIEAARLRDEMFDLEKILKSKTK